MITALCPSLKLRSLLCLLCARGPRQSTAFEDSIQRPLQTVKFILSLIDLTIFRFFTIHQLTQGRRVLQFLTHFQCMGVVYVPNSQGTHYRPCALNGDDHHYRSQPTPLSNILMARAMAHNICNDAISRFYHSSFLPEPSRFWAWPGVTCSSLEFKKSSGLRILPSSLVLICV